MRYFKDRYEAGSLLAAQMDKFAPQNCAVVALSEGGIIVGAEIAKKLHASIFLLSIKDIVLPRELEPVASMSSAGTFTFNHSLSPADLEEIGVESRTLLDQLRLETFQSLNRIISKDGEIDKKFLKNHTVIIVSDGIQNGLSVDVANDFLKPILTKKTVVATPICNARIVDKIRLMSSDFVCIDVLESEFPIDHYYEENKIPDHEGIKDIMSNVILNWS